MPFYLAIDAGGTSTRCALADSTHILARSSTATIKLMRVSESEATARLHAMLAEVSASAGVPLTQIACTCIGLAGLTIPAVRAWATAALAAKVSGEVILLGDEEIALDAAFHSGSGILVIAGTGSNVIGRASSGARHSAGGWGPILGDEGSGYWIGLEAIRASLRARDHEPIPPSSTSLLSRSPTSPKDSGAPSMAASSPWVGSTPAASLLLEIQRVWSLDSLAALIELGNHRGDATRPAPEFAALTPIVARLAEQGNPIAADILHRAGSDLAALVTLVAHKITAGSATPTPDLAIAFTGSVLTHIAPVRTAMAARLAVTLPTARLHPTPVDPLDGALYRAGQA